MATITLDPSVLEQPSYQRLLSVTAHLLLEDADADTLCQRVFETLREPMQIDVYFHYVPSEEGDYLELASSGGSDDIRAFMGSRLDYGQAVCGLVAQTCEWMYVTDIQNRTDETTGLIRSFGIRCYTCQPLTIRGRLIGTLSFGSNRRDRFLPEEIELFRLVAQQVTLATDRRLQNEHMRRLEQLAVAGRMAATLAHEINNPLESLTNLVYLLRDECPTPVALEHVHEAEAQIARLAETTQRTLDLFRGKQRPPQRVELRALFRDVLANMAMPHRIELRTNLDDVEGPELWVCAIPGELRQVFFNLLLNAAQFTPEGKAVTVMLERSGNCAQFRVKDQGPGIPASSRGNLFKPFYTTRRKGGTGIGLWLSREMVERVGGSLTFESNPEIRPGTEFIASLPLLSQHPN